MNQEYKFPLEGDWSVGEAAFSRIIAEFGKVSPRHILEFGSGVSSVRLAMAFPDASILSVDHDPKFYLQTEDLIGAARVENLTVILAPIRKQWIGTARYESYDLQRFHGQEFDAVLIDGPPERFLFGREATLYRCYESVREGGIIILDDHARPMERLAVRNWQQRYPDSFDVTTDQIGHGIAILLKRRHSGFSRSISMPLNNAAEWHRRTRMQRAKIARHSCSLGLGERLVQMVKTKVRSLPILGPILRELRAEYELRFRAKEKK